MKSNLQIRNFKDYISWREGIKTVVLVSSSSRSGSSATVELLKGSDQFNHLRAEINPVLKELKLTPPFTINDQLGYGDFLRLRENGQLDYLTYLLLNDIGRPIVELQESELIEIFTLNVIRRLQWQWPNQNFKLSLIEKHIVTYFDINDYKFNGKNDFWNYLVCKLQHDGYNITGHYYDLSINEDMTSDLQLDEIVEEPPFVPIIPYLKPTFDQLNSKPLLIKTPSNSYRWEFFFALFPNAEFKVLHLIRHPLASINGIIDGWLYPYGFQYFKCDNLEINGYSGKYWCFDAPPGWENYKRKDLRDIASFQYASAHYAINDAIMKYKLDHLRIKFEDLFYGEQAESLSKISKWLFDSNELTGIAREIEPIMATKNPTKDRWKKRIEWLSPIIDLKSINDLHKIFGYAL